MEDRFILVPEQASTMAPRIDAAFWFTTAVCAFFTVVIAILVMYFAVRYRRRAEDHYPRPVVGSLPLELTWSIVPFIIALGMFAWGASIYMDVFSPPAEAMEVYVNGK